MLSRLTRAVPVGACLLALLGGGFAQRTSNAPPQPILQPIQLHSRHGCSVFGGSSIDGSSCPQYHLVYDGGKLVSNVKLVMVLYGSGTYASYIANDTAPSMASFYSQVTNSAYMDWLKEYNSSTQTIGRGTYAGKYTITPATSGSGITDAQLQAELQSQINGGHLPAPDANTLYMVHFPVGVIPHNGCVSGGFCAYHGTSSVSGTEFFYAVFPDISSGACNGGCGGSTAFNNQCSAASHEMVETITDAEIGNATIIGPPLAWYWFASSSCQGEIGNICNQDQTTFPGSDGFTYTVQNQWSNAASGCIAKVPLTTAHSVLSYERSTGTYRQIITVTNTGSSTITGPISIVLDSIANATVFNATGTTGTMQPSGSPYLSQAGNLASGASIDFTVRFTKTGSGSVNYNLRAVAGPGTR